MRIDPSLESPRMPRNLFRVGRSRTGLGLFATKPIKRRTIIAEYKGRRVTNEVADPPLTPPDFGGHPGQRLLYAERLAQHEKPGWFPTGTAIEAVELVWQQLGRDTRVLPLAQQSAAACGFAAGAKDPA